MAAHIQITAGGTPDPAALAALVAGAHAVFGAAGPGSADERPEAYRSRWRRAALLENTEIPVGIKDNGPAWGGTA